MFHCMDVNSIHTLTGSYMLWEQKRMRITSVSGVENAKNVICYCEHTILWESSLITYVEDNVHN